MSNEPPKTRAPIAAIRFRDQVSIGNQRTPEWLASRDAKTSYATTTVAVDYERRLVTITYDSPAFTSYAETPFENVAEIVRIPVKGEKK